MKRKTFTLTLIILLVSASLFAASNWSQIGVGAASYNGAFVEQVEFAGQYNSKKAPLGLGLYGSAGIEIGSLDNFRVTTYAHAGLAKHLFNDTIYAALMVGPGTEFVARSGDIHFDFALGVFAFLQYCLSDSLAIYVSGSYTQAFLDIDGNRWPEREGFSAGIGFAYSLSKWGLDDPTIFIPY